MIQSVNGISFADYSTAIKNGNEQRLRITFPNKNLNEENVYENGLTYSAILNSETDLTIGKAVCASVYIPLVNDGSFANFNFKQQFTVELGVVINNVCQYAPLGTFIGEKPKRLMGDTIELIGYDLMTLFDKETAEVNAKDFLTSLTYPKTIGQIFDALCTYYGVTGNRTQAINASRQIEDAPFDGNGITGRDILSWIAEACGCYARISRTGVCELVWFSTTSYSIDGNDYFNIEPMEYDVDQIDQVRVQVTEKDVGKNYPASGTFEHTYAIIDNPFLYATTASSLNNVTQNLYNRLHAFPAYTPCSVYTDGNWLVESGDIITVIDLDDTTEITLPIFNYTLNWSGRAECTYESTGSEERESVTTVQKQIIRQNTKYHEIETDIDTLRSMIISSSFHIYVQQEDPVDTVGQGELVRGDFWVFPGLETWDDVKWKNFEHTVERTWGEVWNSSDGGYKWFQMFNKTQCWDGNQWIPISDNSIIAEQSSRIEQTVEAIELEVMRANSAEGHLSSSIQVNADNIALEVMRATMMDEHLSSRIDMTESAISLEVERATGAEQTLQSNINLTEQNIHLGVTSVGKVLTSGSYILIESNKIDINSDGSINLKAGATFTVASNNFSIDANGNVTMTGNVTANTGKIGGWFIGSDYLGNKNTKASSSVGLHALATNETASDTYVIWAGNATQSNANFSVKGDGTVNIKKGSLNIGNGSFVVDSSGNVTISKGSITIGNNFSVNSSGVIMAKSGTVGGWNLGTDYIGNANTRTGSSIGFRSNATGTAYSLWLGGSLDRPSTWSAVQSLGTWNTVKANTWSYFMPPPFYVCANGKMYSTGGKIGGWDISEYAITSTSVGLSSKENIVFWAGNANASSANFRIYRDGSVFIGSGSIGLGGSASSPQFYVNSDGQVVIKNGSINIRSGSIRLGDKFVVTSEGVMTATNATLYTVTARSGYIGNGTSGWSIGSTNIHNGLETLSGSTNGTYVGTDGIAVYKDAQHSFKVEKSNGYITVKGGMESVDDTTHTSGMFIGSTGIALGGGKFKVTSAGALTAKSGYIGNGSSGWTIGNNSIYNGPNTSTATTAGIYLGVDGIWIYKDSSHNIKLDKATGVITIKGGKTGIGLASSSQTAGVYIGSDGIALGRTSVTNGNTTTYYDAFSVNSSGILTARSGTIGGWTIGTSSLSKLDKSGSTVVSNVGMSSSGEVSFYAGQADSPSNCAFKVTKTGKVYLTTLFARVVNESAPGYDPENPSTWQWMDSQVDLGTNAYKIGSGYKTVRSVSGGKVTLSDGSSFSTATSTFLTASWSGGTSPVTLNSYGSAVFNINSPSQSNISTSALHIVEEPDNKRMAVSCTLFGSGSSAYRYMPLTATYNKGHDEGVAEGANNVTLSDLVWAYSGDDVDGNGRTSNTISNHTVGRPTTLSKSATISLNTGSWSNGSRTITVQRSGGEHVCIATISNSAWTFSTATLSSTTEPTGHTWARTYTISKAYTWAYFSITVNGQVKYVKIHLTT